jgi:transcriptional regulator with XRE-family HTH domain
MARPAGKKKSQVSQALIDLRARLRMNQHEFAARAGVAFQTVAKYETKPPERGQALEAFQKVAGDTGHIDLMNVFARARKQTGDDIAAMIEHVQPQLALANAVIAREIRFKARLERIAPHMDEAAAKELRDDLIQMLIDYARDWREHMLREVKHERDLRVNA